MKDLIIDCFAGGGGASVGIEMALGRPVDIAINHDPDAILMHKTNHPDTLHLTEDIFRVDLKKYVKGRHVSLMWASPDCTSHSKAKGGKGIIVMDIPKNCGECQFYRQFVGFAQSCVISGRDVDSRCKPSWCPIKQVSNSERGMKAWED